MSQPPFATGWIDTRTGEEGDNDPATQAPIPNRWAIKLWRVLTVASWRHQRAQARAQRRREEGAWEYHGTVGSTAGQHAIYVNHLTKQARTVGPRTCMVDYEALIKSKVVVPL